MNAGGAVERRHIPHEYLNIYDTAAELRKTLHKGFNPCPDNSQLEYVLMKPLEDEIIDAFEWNYEGSIKCSTVLFFKGKTEFGIHSSYTTLILFDVSAGVMIGGIQLEEKYCYDIFGKCTLSIPAGGRVGA
ncbi:hypothetical protein CISG_10216 [Coccidioides immitis RMSCC 3703]|uniref:Uncharacterized protein n=1 Tax=Coccidioides immitis RMSCC 3703 TaxID=454286 RepID=A0A0J8QN28_COCIT|nr:hypothetical protein CISG_10216 [Coccidioides immitis RMSCC 3703]